MVGTQKIVDEIKSTSAFKGEAVFRFCLTQTPMGYTDDGWPFYDGGEPELMTDIYEVWQGYSICTNYDFSITFDQGDREVGSLQERR